MAIVPPTNLPAVPKLLSSKPVAVKRTMNGSKPVTPRQRFCHRAAGLRLWEGPISDVRHGPATDTKRQIRSAIGVVSNRRDRGCVLARASDQDDLAVGLQKHAVGIISAAAEISDDWPPLPNVASKELSAL